MCQLSPTTQDEHGYLKLRALLPYISPIKLTALTKGKDHRYPQYQWQFLFLIHIYIIWHTVWPTLATPSLHALEIKCVSYMGMYFCITHTCILPQVLQESIEEVLHPAGWEQNKGPDASQKLIHKVFNILSPFMLWLLLLKQVIARTKSFPPSKGRISYYCWLLQFKLCPYSTNK